MSRIIKFRAWDEKEKRMTESWNLWEYQKKNQGYLSNKILMQFTGLFDKNKVEAYHKDIVSTLGFEWIIEWHKNGWKLKQIGIEHYQEIPDDFIIFANCHENPDLMNEG